MKISLRKKLVATAVVGLGLTGLAAGPALAAPGDTTASFTITGGSLSISVPASKELSSGTGIAAGSLAAQLGQVAVQDHRGTLLASWAASATSTAFTTGASPGVHQTIANTNVQYTSGLPAVASGVAVPVGTGAAGVTPVTLDQSRTVMSTTGVVGTSSVNWNPTLAVTVPDNVVAGTYSGVVTHSVA